MKPEDRTELLNICYPDEFITIIYVKNDNTHLPMNEMKDAFYWCDKRGKILKFKSPDSGKWGNLQVRRDRLDLMRSIYAVYGIEIVILEDSKYIGEIDVTPGKGQSNESST